MKVLLLSDLHGKLPRKILEKVKEADLTLIAGDFAPYSPGNYQKAKEEEKEVLKKLASTKKKIFIVSGNIDFPENVKEAIRGSEIIYLDSSSFPYNGLSIVGFSFGHSYQEIKEKASKLLSGKSILITHEPPFNTKVDIAYNGEHVGNLAYREIDEEFQPLLHLCGHIHEGKGVDEIGNTLIINPGPAKHGHYVLLEVSFDKDFSVTLLEER